jgi:hypothetical protein
MDVRDVMDEAVAGSLRSSLFFRAGAGSFRHYGRTVVRRALARYIERAAVAHHRRVRHEPLEDVPWSTRSSSKVPRAWRLPTRRPKGSRSCVTTDAAQVAERTTQHPPRP